MALGDWPGREIRTQCSCGLLRKPRRPGAFQLRRSDGIHQDKRVLAAGSTAPKVVSRMATPRQSLQAVPRPAAGNSIERPRATHLAIVSVPDLGRCCAVAE